MLDKPHNETDNETRHARWLAIIQYDKYSSADTRSRDAVDRDEGDCEIILCSDFNDLERVISALEFVRRHSMDEKAINQITIKPH